MDAMIETTTTATERDLGWTVIRDEAAHAAALRLARGTYQMGILRGAENLSGSTLRGEARRWGAGYLTSRSGLLSRLSAAGIKFGERRGSHGKRILIIG